MYYVAISHLKTKTISPTGEHTVKSWGHIQYLSGKLTFQKLHPSTKSFVSAISLTKKTSGSYKMHSFIVSKEILAKACLSEIWHCDETSLFNHRLSNGLYPSLHKCWAYLCYLVVFWFTEIKLIL